MKNKTTSYLILTTCITLCAIGGLIYYVAYIKGLNQKTVILKEEIEIGEIRAKREENIHKSAEQTLEHSRILNSYFVQTGTSIDFVTKLEQTASALSLVYNTNSIDEIQSDELAPYDKELLKISMTTSGVWKNILKFLAYIETLPYPIHIEKIELGRGGSQSISSSTSPVWKFSILLSVVKVKDK